MNPCLFRRALHRLRLAPLPPEEVTAIFLQRFTEAVQLAQRDGLGGRMFDIVRRLTKDGTE